MFPDKKAVKVHVCSVSIETKQPFVIERSEPKRFVVRCPEGKACQFKMSFYKQADGMFHVAEHTAHSCDSVQATVTRLWVCERAKEMMAERGKIVKTELQDRIRETFRVNVDDTLLANAVAQAKRELLGPNSTFGLVEDFLVTLRQSNVGTTAVLVSEEHVFQRAFLCLGMCVRAFEHTTRVIALDGCHLKTKFGGCLLVMTMMEGNGQVFPAAIAIVESENASTWRWFVQLMRDAFGMGEGEGVVALTDREKGIELALSELLPRAVHGRCVFHIQKNVVTRFNTNLNGLLWKAANAPNKKAFRAAIKEMKAINPAAGEYVEGIDKKIWARAYFPVRRFGHVTSNMAESMNRWLDKARFLDPVGLFSSYIKTLNKLFYRRHVKYMSMRDDALPRKVAKVLSSSLEDGRSLRIVRHAREIFDVQSLTEPGVMRTVHLGDRTCTCGFYKEHGIPCRHICAACLLNNEHPKIYVVKERSLAELRATYSSFTTPVDVSLLEDNGLKPPS